MQMESERIKGEGYIKLKEACLKEQNFLFTAALPPLFRKN